MVSKEIILTKDGLEKLEKELEHLKTVKRREVSERIKIAISYGDISENSEYEDAKNEQAFIEGRIITLDKMIRNARVIKKEQNSSIVTLGATVILEDQDEKECLTFTIVGSAESDPSEQKISNESPVGRAVLGKEKGAVVEVKVPAGVVRYKIVEIK